MAFEPYPGQEKHLRNVPIALSCVTFILVAARLVTTWKNRGWFGIEDLFIILAFFSLVVFCVILVQASRYGFGKHRADIIKTGGSITVAFKYYYLSQIFYKTTITINKLAFLFLYLRIFAIKLFRRICLTLIAIIIASGIAFVFLTIFQCKPISKVWRKNEPGVCVNLAWFRWTWASFNLFTDVLIFTIPMPIISRLHMSLSKKIGLGVVFVIGFFICLTTALRMQTLVRAVQASEQTWESCPANMWSFIEAAVGVICACLISLRKILSAIWPDKLRTRSKKGSDYGGYGTGVNSNRLRTGPPPGSHKLDDSDENEYHLESASTFSKHNGTNYDPEGNLLGASNATIMAGKNESQERIIDPNRIIMVRKDVSVQSESH